MNQWQSKSGALRSEKKRILRFHYWQNKTVASEDNIKYTEKEIWSEIYSVEVVSGKSHIIEH